MCTCGRMPGSPPPAVRRRRTRVVTSNEQLAPLCKSFFPSSFSELASSGVKVDGAGWDIAIERAGSGWTEPFTSGHQQAVSIVTTLVTGQAPPVCYDGGYDGIVRAMWPNSARQSICCTSNWICVRCGGESGASSPSSPSGPAVQYRISPRLGWGVMC